MRKFKTNHLNSTVLLSITGIFLFIFSSCQFSKQHTYSQRTERVEKQKKEKLAALGVYEKTQPNHNTETNHSDEIVPPITAPKSSSASIAINTAEKFMGTPYKIGGTSKSGIDCSGLMLMSWKEAGKTLPRISRDQAKVGKQIPFKELMPGDLVFFKMAGQKTISHVGMVYEKKGDKIMMIHASSSRGVIVDELTGPYWPNFYVGGRRIE